MKLNSSNYIADATSWMKLSLLEYLCHV